MGKRRWTKGITFAEDTWIQQQGYCVLTHWIGPVEGTEYMLFELGTVCMIISRKSPRACYNYLRRAIERGEHPHVYQWSA